MAAIIASGICRYAVNASYSGHDVVNIVDMKIDTTGTIQPRDEAVHDQAGRILNAWSDGVIAHSVDKYTAQSVSWIDLDSLDGSTGERSTTDAETWPQSGTIGGAGAPGNVAIRVNKNTTARRGQRQGRMYLCGMAESLTTEGLPNELAEGSLAGFNTMLQALLEAFNNEAQPQDVLIYDSEMVVVHTKDGAFVDSSDVTSLTIDQYTASQVRRIRR
jgi:hypothetical protein